MDSLQQRTRQIYRVTAIGMIVNIVLSVLKLLAGIFGRSGAMIADAIHSFSDLATDVGVFVFAKIASKPEDDDHNYGHGKYETLAAILIGLVLMGVGGGILIDGIRRIRLALGGEVLDRPGSIALIAAVVSILVKELLYRYTVRVGHRIKSPSLIANGWHHRSDAFSSTGTLLGIGCAYFLGEKWRIADPIAALIVAVFIFKIALDLVRDGLDELLEHALPIETELEIRQIITSEYGVTPPSRLRTRRIGSVISIEARLRVDPAMSVGEFHRITCRIEHRLKEHFGSDTLVSLRPEPFEPTEKERRSEHRPEGNMFYL